MDTHLELPYHRAVQLGLFLVEFEGLAEVLQALEGRHSLQFTVIYLHKGGWDLGWWGCRPGLDQSGTILGQGTDGPPAAGSSPVCLPSQWAQKQHCGLQTQAACSPKGAAGAGMASRLAQTARKLPHLVLQG